MLHKLQYISQGSTSAEHLKNIEEVLDAGCLWIQLRMKNFSQEDIEALASKVSEMCKTYNAIFIMNDDVIAAKNCHANGFHLGLTDTPVSEARKMFGEKTIIGGTANTFEHIKQRCKENVDYIGLGPYRYTSTKEKLSPILGIEGYKKIMEQMQKENLNTPIYAIGGIELHDIDAIINIGVYGIAISSLLTKSSNKRQLIKEINNILYYA